MASEAALEGSITQAIMADEGMFPRSNWKLVGRCARLDSRALVVAEVLFMLLLFGLLGVSIMKISTARVLVVTECSCFKWMKQGGRDLEGRWEEGLSNCVGRGKMSPSNG